MSSDYTVLLSRRAQRDLDDLRGPVLSRIERVIVRLEENPRPRGVIKLSGGFEFWRIRVGDYRVLYEIEDAAKRITVHRVVHRREAYR